ncbi:hypothetical protein [Mumia zhuanghuii]|uniref:Uncharacterized protein n=1 Tax=Mumia zhuanghuii TaxID=2585211 RepID=A0A5C4M5K0_9ACTN|nr:hypothetical protein [Mumia zhuanghuii]TNC28432.1 hypothetical protein FHE65_33980 [Mumia zhuanghuii]
MGVVKGRQQCDVWCSPLQEQLLQEWLAPPGVAGDWLLLERVFKALLQRPAHSLHLRLRQAAL